jgi:hypothetical protein
VSTSRQPWTQHGIRLGARRRHCASRLDAAVAAGTRAKRARVVDNLIEAADDEYGVGLVTMLRGGDFTTP